MAKVDPGVATKMWDRVSPDIKHAIRLFCEHGARKQKGQTKAEAMADALIELAEYVYKAGLESGYDMGEAVFRIAARCCREAPNG